MTEQEMEQLLDEVFMKLVPGFEPDKIDERRFKEPPKDTLELDNGYHWTRREVETLLALAEKYAGETAMYKLVANECYPLFEGKRTHSAIKYKLYCLLREEADN